MVSLKQLFEWFTTGKFPTEAQFAEQFKSFWHKSEKIAMPYILGLVDALNGKASKEELANATTKFKGYHTSLAALLAAYPQNENLKDFYAWVGSPYPGTVYKVFADGGAWTDTNEVPTQQEIDLAEYAKKAELAEYLEKSDLIGQSVDCVQYYAPDMNGTVTSGKAASLLINYDAIIANAGILNKISVNAANNGNIAIHILKKVGSVFTSQRSQNITVSAGIKEYSVSLAVEKDNFVGLEISPTNASVKFYQTGKTGYWGGQNGGSFTLIAAGLISYGFKAEFDQEVIERPKEVEDFKTEILVQAQKDTQESTKLLKRSDLVDGGSIFKYLPDMNGRTSTPKTSSMLINALAKTSITGTLSSITINSYDSGKIKLHLFSRAGNVFTSTYNHEINVLLGTNTYNLDINVESEDLYVGLEISATYAGTKYYTTGKEGYYGGANGETMTLIAGGLICYGFTIKQGEGEPRPQEVENFKAEILQEANGGSSAAYSSGHQLYVYNMKAESLDFAHAGWSFSENGAIPSIHGVAGKLYIKKQINIERKIQRCVATLNVNTNLVLYTEGKEESSLKTAVSVNMSDKTINIYEIFSGNALPAIRASKAISFTIVNGNKYIVEMYRLPRANGIRIIDVLTGKTDSLEVYPTQAVHGSDSEVYVGGLQYDQFGVFWNDGNSPIIHELSCGYFGAKNPLLYIAGDSITYGYGTNDPALIYAHLIGALTGGDYVVSPRGGGKIGGIIEKIQTECAIIKPKYIMVTIGTNQAPSEGQLQQLVNAIKSIGSTPIINCIPCRTNGEQMTANNRILALGEFSCRFDIATAINPTADVLKADLSLYVDGCVHPSVEGHKRMAKRARIDLPFLF